jgi:hypothetical protein
MEALKAELERKRKQKAEEFGGRKFVKRSEIEAVRKAQRAELQAPKAEPTPVREPARRPRFTVIVAHCPPRPRRGTAGLGFGRHPERTLWGGRRGMSA